MNESDALERGYRRLLRCYPRSFRRQHEAEMVTVLMASARSDQRRPHAAECVDLLVGAVSTRLRPRVSRTERSLVTTVKLLYIGAAVELATAITLLVSIGAVKSSVINSDPGLTVADWNAVVAGQIDPLVMSAGIAVIFWLWTAWAYGRGKRWTGLLFAIFFAANTWSLLGGLSRGSFVFAQADLAIATVLWLVELAVFILVVHDTLQRIAVARSGPARAGTG